jgi:hypothetical protein
VAVITITLTDTNDGINIQAVCNDSVKEVTPAMVVGYELMNLAGRLHEMSTVPEPVDGLRDSTAH